MNMEDCPKHRYTDNPPYPFVCECPEPEEEWEQLPLWEEGLGCPPGCTDTVCACPGNAY